MSCRDLQMTEHNDDVLC